MVKKLFAQRLSMIDDEKASNFSFTLLLTFIVAIIFNLCSQAHATTVENFAKSAYEVSFATETGTDSITPQEKQQGITNGPAIASYSSQTVHELKFETFSEATGSGGDLKTWTAIDIQSDPQPDDLGWVDFNIQANATSAFKDTISTSPNVHNARFYFSVSGTLAVNADPDPSTGGSTGSGPPPIDPNNPPPINLVDPPFPGELIAEVSLSASLAGTQMSNNSSFETHKLEWSNDGDTTQTYNQEVSFDISIIDLGLLPLQGGDLEVLLSSQVLAVSTSSNGGDFSGAAGSIFNNTVSFKKVDLFGPDGELLSVGGNLNSEKGFDYSAADAASVPLPISIVLFSSGLTLLTMMGWGRRV